MGLSLIAGQPGEAVVFVETLLPPGVDAVRVGGIEYVERVEAVSDLPEGVNAARIGSVAYVPRTTERPGF